MQKAARGGVAPDFRHYPVGDFDLASMILVRPVRNSRQKLAAINAGRAGQHAQVFLSAAPVLSVMARNFEMALGHIGGSDN
jgi:hypothetical protein